MILYCAQNIGIGGMRGGLVARQELVALSRHGAK